MENITSNQFSAYVFFTRDESVHLLGEEIAWYKNNDNIIFAVIRQDYIDNDYQAVLLSRNELKEVRCIDAQINFVSKETAESWLNQKFQEYECSEEYVKIKQNYSKLKKGDLFFVSQKNSNLHPYFKIIKDSTSHIAAKTLINEIMPYFNDIDGNFIQQFQTDGFDSRVWEMYLHCFFNELGFEISREYNAPDFILSDGLTQLSLEAVTVGRKNGYSKESIELTEEFIENDNKKMAIRFGSALFSKLNHTNKDGLHYWEYKHTVNKPFVIAIADFHEDSSMMWTQSQLQSYLYGYEYDYEYDNDDNLIVIPKEITAHSDGDKMIPSGFFKLPKSENISAVISSTQGTIPKFNRIGKQCGFDNQTIMMRYLTVHNPDPNAVEPLKCVYEVTEESEELWSEGIIIYHNPNALKPLDFETFINVTQCFLNEENIIETYMPEDLPHVYNSYTALIVTNNDENASIEE